MHDTGGTLTFYLEEFSLAFSLSCSVQGEGKPSLESVEFKESDLLKSERIICMDEYSSPRSTILNSQTMLKIDLKVVFLQ